MKSIQKASEAQLMLSLFRCSKWIYVAFLLLLIRFYVCAECNDWASLQTDWSQWWKRKSETYFVFYAFVAFIVWQKNKQTDDGNKIEIINLAFCFAQKCRRVKLGLLNSPTNKRQYLIRTHLLLLLKAVCENQNWNLF